MHKHIHKNKDYCNSFIFDCFFILNIVEKGCQSEIKEGMYIDWEKPKFS